MNKPSWKDIAELVGIAAIVASLVFVGVQIRQEAAATRSAAVLQLKDAWIQLNLVQATSVELSEAFETARERGWDAHQRSRDLIEGFYRTLFHNWSNAYYQYRIGTLEHEQWISHLREIEIAVRNDLIRIVWADWEYVFDDEFRRLMSETMAKTAHRDSS